MVLCRDLWLLEIWYDSFGEGGLMTMLRIIVRVKMIYLGHVLKNERQKDIGMDNWSISGV